MPPPPLNETLRQDYFETKFAEFSRGCEEGSAAACFSLGEWFQLVGKDLGQAAKVYGSNCRDRGDPNSCYNLASLVLAKKVSVEEAGGSGSRGGTADELARSLCERACRANSHSLACTTLAHFALTGRGGPRDPALGLTLLENLCASPQNDARACVRLGSAFLKPSYGLPRDPGRAYVLMTRACDELGHPNACQVLAVMLARGDGVPVDVARSEQYKVKTRELMVATGEAMGHDRVSPPSS